MFNFMEMYKDKNRMLNSNSWRYCIFKKDPEVKNDGIFLFYTDPMIK